MLSSLHLFIILSTLPLTVRFVSFSFLQAYLLFSFAEHQHQFILQTLEFKIFSVKMLYIKEEKKCTKQEHIGATAGILTLLQEAITVGAMENLSHKGSPIVKSSFNQIEVSKYTQ